MYYIGVDVGGMSIKGGLVTESGDIVARHTVETQRYSEEYGIAEDIRKVVPNHFLLVPGVGAQGGSLEEVCKYGMTQDCGLIVNSSRGIIYASKGNDFAEAARQAALEVQQQMAVQLKTIF